MKNRAVSGTRTRDSRLGKPMLYQLSYYRKNCKTKIQKIGHSQQCATKINKNSATDKSFLTFLRLIFGNAFQQTRFENKKRTRCSHKNYGIKQQND